MIIIGKGGFAREVFRYYCHNSPRSAFMVESQDLKEWSKNSKNTPTLIAIGDGNIRKKIVGELPNLDYTTLLKGHDYGTNSYGTGTIICPGTIITTNVTIGKHVIINLNCTIGHDCIIGDYTTVSPGANVSGNVTIGECCYLGTNCTIIEKVSICDNVIIGAGSVVIKDITEPGTYVGNPSRKVK